MWLPTAHITNAAMLMALLCALAAVFRAVQLLDEVLLGERSDPADRLEKIIKAWRKP